MNEVDITQEELQDIKSEVLDKLKLGDECHALLFHDASGRLNLIHQYEEFFIPYDDYAENNTVTDAKVCAITRGENDQISISQIDDIRQDLHPNTAYKFDGEDVSFKYPQEEQI